MRRDVVFVIGILAASAVPLVSASAQDAGTQPEAESTPSAQPQRPPVFSLPPGEVREPPQPDVQGPRAPGVSSPRLIDPNAAPPSSSTANRPAPTPTQRQPEPAPPVIVSRPQSAPDHDLQSRVAVSRAPTDAADDDDAPSLADTPRPQIGDQSVAADQPDSEMAASADSVADIQGDQGGLAWWVWLAGLFALVGLAAAIRIFFKRQPAAEEEEVLEPAPLVKRKAEPKLAPEPASEPAPVSAPAPIAPAPIMAAAPPAPPAAEAPSRIEVDFQPLTARLSTLGLTLSYRLTLQNISNAPLRDVAVRLGMRSADGAAMEVAAQAGPPCIELDELEAGASHAHTAEISLDPQTYRPFQSNGKPMLVPIVDMFPCYRDSDDVLHEMHAAMLVGRESEPPTPKMQPFWLERGFGQFGKIGCRMLSVKTA